MTTSKSLATFSLNLSKVWSQAVVRESKESVTTLKTTFYSDFADKKVLFPLSVSFFFH